MIESAIESDIEVTGIDFFGDMDCYGKVITPSDDSEYCSLDLLKKAQEIATSECSGIIYGSGIENYPRALQYWQEKDLLIGNGLETLIQARNPFALRDVLTQIGVKMPDFFSTDTIPNEGTWLLKHIFKGGGQGISVLPSEVSAIRDILHKLDKPQNYVVQEKLDGIPASITFLADGTRALLVGSSYQLIHEQNGDVPFQYRGNIVPLDAPFPNFEKDMERIANHLTAAFGLKGLNTLDFILGDEVKVLELNPRWSGSVELIESWLGRRLFLDHVKACKGELPDKAEWENSKRFCGKEIIFADVTFTVREDADDWQRIHQCGIRDIPRAKSATLVGEPICTVLAEGDSKDECLLKLKEKARLVREFYEQKRDVFGKIESIN
jgi:predicted ATP-grasp superfamily ATP-dependent carboligase